MDKSINMIEKYEKELRNIVKLFMDLYSVRKYEKYSYINKFTHDGVHITSVGLYFADQYEYSFDDEVLTFNIGNDDYHIVSVLNNNNILMTGKLNDNTTKYKPLLEFITSNNLSLPKIIHMLRKEWVDILL